MNRWIVGCAFSLFAPIALLSSSSAARAQVVIAPIAGSIETMSLASEIEAALWRAAARQGMIILDLGARTKDELAHCGLQISCMAKIAQAQHARHVLHVMLRTKGQGLVSLQLSLVGAEPPRLEKTFRTTFDARADRWAVISDALLRLAEAPESVQDVVSRAADRTSVQRPGTPPDRRALEAATRPTPKPDDTQKAAVKPTPEPEPERATKEETEAPAGAPLFALHIEADSKLPPRNVSRLIGAMVHSLERRTKRPVSVDSSTQARCTRLDRCVTQILARTKAEEILFVRLTAEEVQVAINADRVERGNRRSLSANVFIPSQESSWEPFLDGVAILLVPEGVDRTPSIPLPEKEAQ